MFANSRGTEEENLSSRPISASMGPQYPAMTPCELILALDVASREAADAVLAEVCGTVKWVKIGLQLFAACGEQLQTDLHPLDGPAHLSEHRVRRFAARHIEGQDEFAGRHCGVLGSH